jgi:hypothetical protein
MTTWFAWSPATERTRRYIERDLVDPYTVEGYTVDPLQRAEAS